VSLTGATAVFHTSVLWVEPLVQSAAGRALWGTD